MTAITKKKLVTLSAVVIALATMGSSVVGLVRTFNDVPEKKADLAYELFKDQTRLMVEDLLHTRTQVENTAAALETLQQELLDFKTAQSKCVCQTSRVILRHPSTFSSFSFGRGAGGVSPPLLPPPAPVEQPSQAEIGLKSLPESLDVPNP